MLIQSPLLTKASGALAGMVGSHNKGGMYLRGRATPTNPSTSFQQAIRNAINQLSTAWSNTLTQAQRDAWDVYAANQPLTNRLGESRNVPGLAQYTRSNVPRLQAGATRIDDAPTTFTLPSFTVSAVSASEATQLLSITFDVADAWNADDGWLPILCSRPQSVGKVYFKGPYRFADALEGDTAIPLTSPQTVAAPFAFVAGQILFTSIRASNPDGRLATAQRFRTVAAA